MLILSRKVGEEICIGDEISIVIQKVQADGVRIGVRAPKDIPVHRREVYDRIKEDQEKADRKHNEALWKALTP